MAKANRKNTTKAAVQDEAHALRAQEDKLIRTCVVFAQNNAAFNGGFVADPSGNSDYCGSDKGQLGGRYDRAAKHALAELTDMRALTLAALMAKARIAGAITDNWWEESQQFFVNFAGDVKVFLEAIERTGLQPRTGTANADAQS